MGVTICIQHKKGSSPNMVKVGSLETAQELIEELKKTKPFLICYSENDGRVWSANQAPKFYPDMLWKYFTK